jgi:hypothetical protein
MTGASRWQDGCGISELPLARPEALRVGIFDLRAVYGDHLLAASSSPSANAAAAPARASSSRPLRAGPALTSRSILRRFVLASKGEHRETLELKATA